MMVDALVMQGDRASAAMVFIDQILPEYFHFNTKEVKTQKSFA